jgi:hypothetical protein
MTKGRVLFFCSPEMEDGKALHFGRLGGSMPWPQKSWLLNYTRKADSIKEQLSLNYRILNGSII